MVKILHEVKTLKDFNESRCLKKLTKSNTKISRYNSSRIRKPRILYH